MEFSLLDRAIALATVNECASVFTARSIEVIQWGTANLMFWRQTDQNTEPIIIRTTIVGGDTRPTIHGGWKYLSWKMLEQDWREIAIVARAYM